MIPQWVGSMLLKGGVKPITDLKNCLQTQKVSGVARELLVV